MSQDRRLSKLEDEDARRNPPVLTPPIRVLQDGKRVERLDGSDEPIPAGAPLIVREIVDAVPCDDDAGMPPSTFRIVGADGVVDPSSTMRDSQPAERPSELSLEPEPPQPSAPPLSADEQLKAAARESFERRTSAWDKQLESGLGRRAKKRRGTKPSERDGFKQAVKEGRARVRGVDFFGSKPKRKR